MSQFQTPGSIAVAMPVEQAAWKTRLADYAELAKAKIAVMVLITVAVGFLVGSQGGTAWLVMLNVLVGVGLMAASSCTANQLLEIKTDLLMKRTRNRPLPSGRIKPAEAILFAGASGLIGFFWLFLLVNPLTAWLTLCNWILYVAVYTPMKRWTSFCTAIGAIPGAMPPVLGWAAAGQSLGWEAFWLFSIMFLWQFPHFLAIAWLCKEEYYQAGLWMLPGGLPQKYVTGTLAATYAAILIPVSLLPQQYGTAGQVFFWVALSFGLAYFYYSVRFLLNESRQTARGVLFCSLFYLPVVLTALTWNHLSVLNSYAFQVNEPAITATVEPTP